MLNTQEFGDSLKKMGFDFYSGVPCSFLKYLINYAINQCDYIMAANEGDAVAVASGAHIGGRKAVVLMQNSGLTNAISPLTSLNYTFKIPLLGFVSHRGEPNCNDEPQHQLMGKITPDLLSVMGIKWNHLSDDPDKASAQLDIANKNIENGQSFFFIVRKNTFKPVTLIDRGKKLIPTAPNRNVFSGGDYQNESLPTRLSALEVVSDNRDPDTVLIATTGKTGRELFELKDHSLNFYMVGSMGCASSLGLGIALSQPQKKIVVLDGDGSLLMRMGAMPTIAYYDPPNLLHILLDNRTHDSTGGQFTVSPLVNFSKVSMAVGYRQINHAASLYEFQRYFKKWVKKPELTFLYLEIDKGSKQNLGRPTIKPPQVKIRLQDNICAHG